MAGRVSAPPAWEGPRLAGPSSDGPLEELRRLMHAELATKPPPARCSDADGAGIEAFTFEHDCALLREPWPSSAASATLSRPCVFGRRCIAMHPGMPGHEESGGVVLGEAMTPSELEAFEAHGTHPSERRPCLLCVRANVTASYLEIRRTRRSDRPPAFVINWFVNPVGVSGAYAEDVSIPFKDDGDAWMGVYGRVAAFCMNLLKLKQDPTTRRWYVDQSAMAQAQDFERGAACKGATSDESADAALRRFLTRRPDVWDGTALIKPLPHDVTRAEVRCVRCRITHCTHAPLMCRVAEDVFPQVQERVERLKQLAAAYGTAAGPLATWAMASKLNDAMAVHHALATGLPSSAARMASAPCECNLPDIGMIVMLASAPMDASGRNCRSKRPRKTAAEGDQLLMQLLMRVMDDASSARVLSDATARALACPDAAHAVERIVACSLLGGYVSCRTRPSPATRARLVSLDAGRLLQQLRSLSGEVPVVWCAFTEYVLHVVFPRTPQIHALINGVSWVARTERVQLTMDSVRMALDTNWAADASLSEALRGGLVRDAFKRMLRRDPRTRRRRGVAIEPVTTGGMAELVAACAGVRPAHDEVRRFIARIEAGNLAVPVSQDTARAALSGAKLTGRDGEVLAAAVAALNAVRLLRRVHVSNKHAALVAGIAGDRVAHMEAMLQRRVARSVFMCCNCMSVKNFVVRMGDSARAVRTCGYVKLTAPNPVENDPRITCDATPDCAAAHIRHVDILGCDDSSGAACGGLVIAGNEAIALSPCCGTMCSTRALRVTADGRWQCAACTEPG